MNRTIASALQLLLLVAMIVGVSGCGAPTPTTVGKGPPPPPPPIPVVVEKPAPPPVEKPKADPLQTALNEASGIVKRYSAIYASVKDEATADKAVQDIAKMIARLRELTAEISKLPPRPGDEQFALAFQNDLAQLSTAQLNNPDIQRVLVDPDLGLKFIGAQQSFVTEGLLPLGNALAIRQSPAAVAPGQPATAQPPTSQPPTSQPPTGQP
jgi:hypothetical protein